MLEHKLVGLIRDCVRPLPKPAVYISGGLDSSIILFHLKEKTDEEIYSYTFGFAGERNEFEVAQKVAEHYGTKHKQILIDDLLSRFPDILKHFDRPRFNLWVYWLADHAFRDRRKTCYVGEACDEHFGGYWYKPHLSYIECWVDHYIYIRPTYETVHKIFGLRIEIPFSNLDFKKTLAYWDPKREKTHLREAYKDILPDFVVHRRKKRGGPNWQLLWERELSKIYPKVNPKSNQEIRSLLNRWVTREWLKLHMV